MQTVRELRPPRGAPPGCGDGEDGILAIENAFTPEECDRLSALLDAGVSAGGLAGGAVVSDIRACDIRWLDDDAETGWVFGRLARLIARANRELFGYDLTGFDEGAQVIRYTADRMGGSGGYDWHVDRGRAEYARLVGLEEVQHAEEGLPGIAAAPEGQTRASCPSRFSSVIRKVMTAAGLS